MPIRFGRFPGFLWENSEEEVFSVVPPGRRFLIPVVGSLGQGVRDEEEEKTEEEGP